MNGKSTASLVCGIIACVIGWINYCAFIGIPCAIIALVLSSQCRKAGYETGTTKAGLITGIIGLILCSIGIVWAITCIAGCYGCYACEVCSQVFSSGMYY